MLKKGLLVTSIVFQVVLVGFMGALLVREKSKPELIEDLFFEDEVVINKVKEEIVDDAMFSIPFRSYLETTGVVIPSSGYVKVSNPIEGAVTAVYVNLGDEVKVNTPLFKIDDKSIYVEIKEKEARLEKSVAELSFHKKGPSKYAILKQKKAIEEIEIKKENQEKEAAVFEKLLEKTAVSCAENNEKHMFLQMTEKELEKANADYDELCSGISDEEESIYLNDIEEKKAGLKQSALKLESSLVKSPMKGRVVDINVARGEYLSDKGELGVTLIAEDPAMIKVSISEGDAYKLKLGKELRAVAFHRSNPEISFILDFAYFNPKMSIYRGDERRLDLFFTFDRGSFPIYIEQSLDVFIETVDPVDLSFLHYKFN